ncbi:MAG: ATPase [Hyphomicrobiaceae bacterium]|nr:ATPase [Hyphomicrobiaceae bacterium]
MNSTENGSGSNGTDNKPSGGPKGAISDSLAKPLPKRFYNEVSVSDGAFFQILLDGRVVRTPKKRALVLPTRKLADAVAAEWAAQKDVIDPSTMPMTRFSNTAIDAVADAADEVAADIVAYAGRDLLCYRAETPAELAIRQTKAWDPVIDWAREALGAHFTVVDGVMPVDQPALTLQRIAKALEPHEPFRLTALHVMTTLTGSAILALAQARGFLSSEQAWTAAHVDEDYQISVWGEDYEAAEKRKQRQKDFDAASRLIATLT